MYKFFFLKAALCCISYTAIAQHSGKKPNILFCIADDASFQHFGAYGYNKTAWVKTPGFDQVAKDGLLFTRAYTPNAKCAPSRASILTGRNPWQLEEAGNHNPFFPVKFTTVMEVLYEAGYETGFTGKGWGPGNPGMVKGKPRLLTGREYSQIKMITPTPEISPIDYAANLEAFIAQKQANKPFCFWVGFKEPHREYEFGSGVSKGSKNIADIDSVPPFWIDNEKVRNDMLDYAFEVEYFDKQLQKILNVLEKTGELDNTIVIVTSDNGMPFPRIKGHLYDYDNHLPLAIMWKGHLKNPGRKITDFVSFIDFTPTFLDVAGISNKQKMQFVQGKSLRPYFEGTQTMAGRHQVLLGREREDVGRPGDVGYPVRAIVKGHYFYAINFEPDRWPSGNPETGYMDTDGSPTKTALLAENRKGNYHELWKLNFGKKPKEELYNVLTDPYSMKNLAADSAFLMIKNSLRAALTSTLKAQGDPRMFGNGNVFDKYPYSVGQVQNFYERFMKGEKMRTDWIRESDFEKPGFDRSN